MVRPGSVPKASGRPPRLRRYRARFIVPLMRAGSRSFRGPRSGRVFLVCCLATTAASAGFRRGRLAEPRRSRRPCPAVRRRYRWVLRAGSPRVRRMRDAGCQRYSSIPSAARSWPLGFQRALAEELFDSELGAGLDDRWHRHLLRLMGDALAWQVLSRHAIRERARDNRRSPTLSGQGSDFGFVIEVAQQIAHGGSVPVVCDLTRLLGLGDIVAVTAGLSRQSNARTRCCPQGGRLVDGTCASYGARQARQATSPMVMCLTSIRSDPLRVAARPDSAARAALTASSGSGLACRRRSCRSDRSTSTTRIPAAVTCRARPAP